MATPQPTAPPPPPPPPRWKLKTEDGAVYGPVPRAELDEWCAEGRVNVDCQLQQEGEPGWRPASDLYRELAEDDADEATPAQPTPTPRTVAAPTRSRRSVSRERARASSQATISREDASDDEDASEDDQEAADDQVSDRRWITTFLLAFFLGTLGIHRFYLGHVLSGVAMLFTCGGCFVWQIVDIVRIALEKLPDHAGRPLKK